MRYNKKKSHYFCYPPSPTCLLVPFWVTFHPPQTALFIGDFTFFSRVHSVLMLKNTDGTDAFCIPHKSPVGFMVSTRHTQLFKLSEGKKRIEWLHIVRSIQTCTSCVCCRIIFETKTSTMSPLNDSHYWMYQRTIMHCLILINEPF